MDEVERNLTKKVPEKIDTLHQLMQLIEPEMVNDPTTAAVQATAEYVAAKDAPIVAAAIAAQPDYLVTYDRKHLLEPPEVAQRSGLTIVTPDIVITAIQEDENKQ